MSENPVIRLAKCTLKHVANFYAPYLIYSNCSKLELGQLIEKQRVQLTRAAVNRFQHQHSREYERMFSVNGLSGHSVCEVCIYAMRCQCMYDNM